jgi:hypothetical protein
VRRNTQLPGDAVPRPADRHTDRLRFGILCVLGYVALSWAVRFDMRHGEQIASLLYPLDTFSMYAGSPGEYVSHVLIRDQQGTIHHVTAFQSFDCAQPVARREAACADSPGYAYLYDDIAGYIESHRGAGDAEVELIYRTWQVRSGAAPVPISDCVIARCKVSR